jgi:hypothetical protein
MTATLQTLEAQVLRLPPEQRSYLLDRLIESLDEQTALDEAWDQEAARRDAEIEEGLSIPVDGRAVVARLRSQAQ